MTPDPKAPLPDEVEEVIKRVGYLDALYGYNYAETIRAHIAAQAEKIAELEEKIEVLKVKAKGAYDRSMMLLDAKKYFYEKCAALEAENKRLREQNKQLHQHVSFYHRWATRNILVDGHKPEEIERSHYGVMRHYPLTEDEIAALAQTEVE